MEQNQTLFSLTIDPLTKAHLNDTARWARFLAIVGMVMLVLAVVGTVVSVTVFAGRAGFSMDMSGVPEESMTNAMRAATVVGVLIMLAIAFFPLLFLFQFSGKMRRALTSNDQEELNLSFLNLKKYFRYLGIIVIIVLALYALMFILMIMGTALGS